MNHIYLGYDNPRKAWHLPGYDIVVLKDGDLAFTLEGPRAKEFLKRVSALSHHICGVRFDAESRKLMSIAKSSGAAYALIFEEYLT